MRPWADSLFPQVGWGATSPALSDKARHPFFVRTVVPGSTLGYGMWSWMKFFNFPMTAFFYTKEFYGEGLFTSVSELATAAGVANWLLSVQKQSELDDCRQRLSQRSCL